MRFKKYGNDGWEYIKDMYNCFIYGTYYIKDKKLNDMWQITQTLDKRIEKVENKYKIRIIIDKQ